NSQTSASIAINPADPNWVIAAGLRPNFGEGAYVGISIAASQDGGVTWESTTIGNGNDDLPIALGSEPRVAYDKFGNLFVAYVDNGNTLQVLHSSDNGENFTVLHNFEGGEPKNFSLATGSGGETAPSSVWLSWADNSTFSKIKAAGAAITGL